MAQDRMTPTAMYSYDAYRAAGWTDEQLIAHGYLRPLPVTSFEAVAADEQLRLFLERIERLREEKKGIADDERDVFSEAKSQGYDAKIMREILKLRAMTDEDRHEMEALLETYKAASGLD